MDLHGQEDVFHDDTVEVEEADDTRHSEITGLGSKEVMDPIKINHVHIVIFTNFRLGGEEFPGIT